MEGFFSADYSVCSTFGLGSQIKKDFYFGETENENKNFESYIDCYFAFVKVIYFMNIALTKFFLPRILLI